MLVFKFTVIILTPPFVDFNYLCSFTIRDIKMHSFAVIRKLPLSQDLFLVSANNGGSLVICI